MKAIQKDFTAEKVDDMAMELQEQMDVAGAAAPRHLPPLSLAPPAWLRFLLQ